MTRSCGSRSPTRSTTRARLCATIAKKGTPCGSGSPRRPRASSSPTTAACSRSSKLVVQVRSPKTCCGPSASCPGWSRAMTRSAADESCCGSIRTSKRVKPPSGWIQVRTAGEAVALLDEFPVQVISFNSPAEASAVVHWLHEQGAEGRDRWPRERVRFHCEYDPRAIDPLIAVIELDHGSAVGSGSVRPSVRHESRGDPGDSGSSVLFAVRAGRRMS